MAQECGFFNAQLVGEEYDRVYLAEQFAAYFASFIGNGVYGDSMGELEVTANDNMTTTVLSGQAWINGWWYRNTTGYVLEHSIADGVLSRIDIIVLRWDSSARDIHLAVIEGTPSANPIAPSIVRNADYYDLQLCSVSIPAGSVKITQAQITDTRLNNSVCGLVTGVVDQIDTSSLFTQFQTAFQEWKENQQADYETWTAAKKAAYDEFVEDAEQDFGDWFEYMKGQLTEDAAGHLQNEIGILTNLITTEKSNLVGAVNELKNETNELQKYLRDKFLYSEKALIFVSDYPFTVRNKNNITGFCDGTLEVVSGNGEWNSWDGSTVISSSKFLGKHIIKFRGTGNTYFYKSSSVYLRFVLTGSNIELYGSCNYLLDYTREITTLPTPSVSSAKTFREMFRGCTRLTSLPSNLLPATTLADSCYLYMFASCTGITTIPSGLLPATNLAAKCYQYMFNGCGIESLPSGLLPATNLAADCYSLMFATCDLKSIPSGFLPATNLAVNCYGGMFSSTRITTIPSGLLHATNLAAECYSGMFLDCPDLTTLPANLLPATNLASSCYANMFMFCTSLRLSNTQSTTYNKKVVQFGTISSTSAVQYMFEEVPNVTATPTSNQAVYSA